jgi:hypothetical protein
VFIYAFIDRVNAVCASPNRPELLKNPKLAEQIDNLYIARQTDIIRLQAELGDTDAGTPG